MMRKLALLSMLFLAVPAVAVDFETQQASSGPLSVSITCQTTDFVGVATSYIEWSVEITNFSSNDPTQLWWGVWELDLLVDDLIWNEVIDPSTSDPEYDPSTDTWSKAVYVYCDISSYEPPDAQAEVYAYAEMTSPNYTAQTPDILVNLVTDSIPPETSITSPASGTYGPDITFEFTATDDYTQAGEFGFYWWLEPLESKPSEPSGEASAPYAGLSAGNYTFKVAAIDRGLNEDPTPASVAITVETISAPDAPSGPSVATTGQQVTFTCSGAISSEGHVLEYHFDFGDATITAWSSSTSVDHTYSSAGTFEVKAQARCPAHSIESAWSSASSIDVTAPQSSGGCLASGSATALACLLPLACAAVALRRRSAAT